MDDIDKMKRAGVTPNDIKNHYDKLDRIQDDKIDSATCTNVSACDTCQSIVCQCCEHNDEEDLFECHLTGDVKLILPELNNRPLRSGRLIMYDVVVSDKDEKNSVEYHLIVDLDIAINKVQDGFLLVCALFALSFNRVVDYIVNAFKKGYQGWDL